MAPAEGFVVSSVERARPPSASSQPTLLAIEPVRLANSTGMLHIEPDASRYLQPSR